MLPDKLIRKKIIRNNKFQRLNRRLRHIIVACGLLLFTLLTGVVGFMLIEDYSFLDAIYMTIITLGTVGYGEVKPLTESGKIFASCIIVFNISTFAYAVSVISSFIIEGDLRSFLKDYRTYRKVRKMENHVIVCGFGRHGKQIAEELSSSNTAFVIIELEDEHIEEIKDCKHPFLEGDATEDDILIEAGIHKAKAIVITFGEDASNVYAVLTAKELNPKIRIIARASNHSAEKKLLRAGADYVVMSEVIGGFYMATLVHQPQVVEFFNILSNMGDEVSIHFKEVEYKAIKTAYKDGQIKDLNIRSKTGVNIIGVRTADGQYVVNPAPTTCINKGMRLIVLGDKQQIESFESYILQTP